MKTSVMFSLILLLFSCSQQNYESSYDAPPRSQVAYKWMDTDLDRYMIYADDDVIADIDGVEDIRVISTSYEKWGLSKVIIRSTDDPKSDQRIAYVRNLFSAFGVADEDILIQDIRAELSTEENLLHMSLDISDTSGVYAKSH